jgi:hypothetical protein
MIDFSGHVFVVMQHLAYFAFQLFIIQSSFLFETNPPLHLLLLDPVTSFFTITTEHKRCSAPSVHALQAKAQTYNLGHLSGTGASNAKLKGRSDLFMVGTSDPGMGVMVRKEQGEDNLHLQLMSPCGGIAIRAILLVPSVPH